MSKAGGGITFTSLTDLAAFLMGSFTQIPAIHFFCLYAACAVVAVYFMQVCGTLGRFTLRGSCCSSPLLDGPVCHLFCSQITFFSACLALDIQRQARGRADVFMCSSACGVSNTEPPPDMSWMQRKMKQYYAGPVSTNRWVQIPVVVLFVGMAAMAVGGIPNMQQGLPLTDLAPSSHYAHAFLQRFTEYV